MDTMRNNTSKKNHIQILYSQTNSGSVTQAVKTQTESGR